MFCKGIYVVTYICSDGKSHNATVQSQCTIAALGIVIEAERQAGRDVISGSAELLCESKLL